MERKSPSPVAGVIIEDDGKILLITRKSDTFNGFLAFPGGFLNYGETIEQAAIREAKEETGLDVKLGEILGVYSDPKIDPRGQTVNVMFVAKSFSGNLQAGDDASDAKFYPIEEIELDKLPFDHAKIISAYIKWKKQKGTYWSTK